MDSWQHLLFWFERGSVVKRQHTGRTAPRQLLTELHGLPCLTGSNQWCCPASGDDGSGQSPKIPATCYNLSTPLLSYNRAFLTALLVLSKSLIKSTSLTAISNFLYRVIQKSINSWPQSTFSQYRPMKIAISIGSIPAFSPLSQSTSLISMTAGNINWKWVNPHLWFHWPHSMISQIEPTNIANSHDLNTQYPYMSQCTYRNTMTADNQKRK